MRTRSKLCFSCNSEHRILYRCKYEQHDWGFLCQQCLLNIKSKHENTYQYGGTWKKFK